MVLTTFTWLAPLLFFGAFAVEMDAFPDVFPFRDVSGFSLVMFTYDFLRCVTKRAANFSTNDLVCLDGVVIPFPILSQTCLFVATSVSSTCRAAVSLLGVLLLLEPHR